MIIGGISGYMCRHVGGKAKTASIALIESAVKSVCVFGGEGVVILES